MGPVTINHYILRMFQRFTVIIEEGLTQTDFKMLFKSGKRLQILLILLLFFFFNETYINMMKGIFFFQKM